MLKLNTLLTTADQKSTYLMRWDEQSAYIYCLCYNANRLSHDLPQISADNVREFALFTLCYL